MIIRFFKKLKEHELRLVAGALAFSTVLAIIPFLALTLTVFQSFGGLEFLVPKIQELFFRYFKEAFGVEILGYIKSTLNKIKPSQLGPAAALFLIFTSFRLMQDMEYGINRMWQKTPSPLYRRMLMAWIFMGIIPVLLAIYAGFRSFDAFKPILKSYRILLDSFLLILGLFSIYKILPVPKVETKKALLGALLSGFCLIILQTSFTFVFKKFFVINKIYGSLAAFPLFLIYVLFVWYIVLIGAAFVASLHKPTS